MEELQFPATAIFEASDDDHISQNMLCYHILFGTSPSRSWQGNIKHGSVHSHRVNSSPINRPLAVLKTTL
jgi:hypothetical protein